jgi:hypothetical protein
VTVDNNVSPKITVEHSFATVFVRPDRFRFEIKDEDDHRLLISSNGQNVRTWSDVEPGIQEPESLDLAIAQALGFSGGDVSRIPAMLMPQELDGWGDLDIIDPQQIEDGKLQNVECSRLEYNFRDEQITLWIDKQSYLVRRIDERIKSDGFRIERTTTYDPAINGKISDKMLEFDPPSLRDEESANVHSTVPQVAPEAKAALDLANIQERRGEFEKSADAYLEAYRLDPSLLTFDQFATIKKAKRTREFVEVIRHRVLPADIPAGASNVTPDLRMFDGSTTSSTRIPISGSTLLLASSLVPA